MSKKNGEVKLEKEPMIIAGNSYRRITFNGFNVVLVLDGTGQLAESIFEVMKKGVLDAD